MNRVTQATFSKVGAPFSLTDVVGTASDGKSFLELSFGIT